MKATQKMNDCIRYTKHGRTRVSLFFYSLLSSGIAARHREKSYVFLCDYRYHMRKISPPPPHDAHASLEIKILKCDDADVFMKRRYDCLLCACVIFPHFPFVFFSVSHPCMCANVLDLYK